MYDRLWSTTAREIKQQQLTTLAVNVSTRKLVVNFVSSGVATVEETWNDQRPLGVEIYADGSCGATVFMAFCLLQLLLPIGPSLKTDV